MLDLSELLNYQDFPSVLALLLLLLFVGQVMSGSDARIHRWSQYAATLCALAHFFWLAYEWRPRAAADVIFILMRALITGGLALATSQIILRVLVTVHSAVLDPLFRRQRAHDASRVQEADRRRRDRDAENSRRKSQEEWERLAPERERAARETDERARQARLDQQRREASRLQCEMLFARHTADIGGRFPRAEFERFLAKHMRDDQPPDVVESCGQQLQAIICQHLDKVQPPPRFRSLQELAAWYAQQKQDIETVADERVRRTLLAQLNERYAEMTSRFLEEQHS